MVEPYGEFPVCQPHGFEHHDTNMKWRVEKKKKIEFSIKKKTNTLLTDKKNIGDSRAKLLYV